MTNSNKPFEKAITKGIKNALLGAAAGLASSFLEDALNPNPANVASSLGDYMMGPSARDRATRREQIARGIISGLVSNMTVPLERPDYLTSLAVNLANKLMEKLDAESSAELRSELEQRAKEAEETAKKQAQGQAGLSQYMTQLQQQSAHQADLIQIKKLQQKIMPIQTDPNQ